MQKQTLMHENCENKRGITLIALVVTIIVLLILAGVSINLVAGSNGILSRATMAVSKTNEAAVEEKIQLAIAAKQMDYYTSGANGTFADYITTNPNDEYEISGNERVVFSSEGESEVLATYYKDDKELMAYTWDTVTNDLELASTSSGTGGTSVDRLKPKVAITETTTSSIKFTLTDKGGLAGYYISETELASVDDGLWIAATGETQEIEKTGLTAHKTYYIYAIDTSGNIRLGVTAKTENFLTIETKITWAGASATVEVTNSLKDLQYCSKPKGTTPADSDFVTYTGTLNVESGNTVYFRRNDGTNKSAQETVGVYKPSKVTYHGNLAEASGVPSAKTVAHLDNVDTSITLTESHGSIFKGWSTDPKATTAQTTIEMGTADIDVYAVWQLSQSCNAAHPEKHIPTGFSHSDSSTVANGYVIKDGAGNEFVWIPVANDAAYAKKMGKNNWYMKDAGEEPGTKFSSVSQAVRGDKLGVTNILGTNVGTNAITDQQPEYPVVKAAGGFWVGRYEAGIPSVARSENLAVTKWNSDPGITVKKGNEPARYIYQSQCLNIANNWKSDSANVAAGTVAFKSGLITGSQWDAMCNFIGWNTCDSDCSSWGNYSNVTGASFTGCTSDHGALNWVQRTNAVKANSGNAWIFPAGAFKNASNGETVQKNIYDVAGNVWEWTTEIPQYSEANAVVRGGSAWDDGSTYLASSRYGGCSATTNSGYNIGFRLVLYVQ